MYAQERCFFSNHSLFRQTDFFKDEFIHFKAEPLVLKDKRLERSFNYNHPTSQYCKQNQPNFDLTLFFQIILI